MDKARGIHGKKLEIRAGFLLEALYIESAKNQVRRCWCRAAQDSSKQRSLQNTQ
jgi:hypothetical protein